MRRSLLKTIMSSLVVTNLSFKNNISVDRDIKNEALLANYAKYARLLHWILSHFRSFIMYKNKPIKF